MYQNDLGAVLRNQLAALFTHRVGHDNLDPVSTDGAHQSNADALIAACRLAENRVLGENALRRRVAQHVPGRARLNRTAHVERLDLDENFGTARLGHALEPDDGRASNRIQNVLEDQQEPPFIKQDCVILYANLAFVASILLEKVGYRKVCPVNRSGSLLFLAQCSIIKDRKAGQESGLPRGILREPAFVGGGRPESPCRLGACLWRSGMRRPRQNDKNDKGLTKAACFANMSPGAGRPKA